MTIKCSDKGDAATIKSSCRVAVIGAGAAGLVAARELVREGHSVVVYEQGTKVGGVWVYDPEVDADTLGLDRCRRSVHSSMYASLRTNLPRDLMGYSDFPFLPRKGRDERRFPGHQEVASYLQEFAEEYDLIRLVRFSTRVEYVGMHSEDCKSQFDATGIHKMLECFQLCCKDCREEGVGQAIQWVAQTRRQTWAAEKAEGGQNLAIRCQDEVRDEVFDAVVICNGHFFQPKVARISGVEKSPGKQLHSHNYRTAEPFRDQVVVIIGSGPSGRDISVELASVANEVHLCARKWDSSEDFSKPLYGGKLRRHLMVEFASEDGTVQFKDGSSCLADVIIHCTGYSYSFPFLDTHGIVTVESNAVTPLYQHVFPPFLAPSISFVGLPFRTFLLPLFELQSKWIALILSKSSSLPSVKDMMAAVRNFEGRLAAEGIPKHHTHCLFKCLTVEFLAIYCDNHYNIDNWIMLLSPNGQMECCWVHKHFSWSTATGLQLSADVSQWGAGEYRFMKS